MTTYTAIANNEIDQDSPVTQPLMTALRDNPLAALESDPSAPLAAFAWQIEDGAGGTDPIYDNSVDGNTSSITTPTFDAGWEYMLVAHRMTHGVGSQDIEFSMYSDNDGSYRSNVVFASSVALTTEYGFQIHMPNSMMAKRVTFASAVWAQYGATSGTASRTDMQFSDGSSDTFSRGRIQTATSDFTGGIVWLLKRAIYAGR